MVGLIFVIWMLIEYYNILLIAVENIGLIFELISTSIFSPQDNISSDIHSTYYFELLNVFSSIDFINQLFGFGMFAAGYPYETKKIVLMSGVWVPESDFIIMFIGNGIIGGILYYLILIKNIICQKNYNNINLNLLLLVFGFFYGTGWIIVVFLLSLCEREFNEKETTISIHNTA